MKKTAIAGMIPAIAVCDPGGILTHDLQNRNLTFYTAELRGLKNCQPFGRFGCKDTTN